MHGITLRRMNHNGKSYPKGAKVSFPDAEFAQLQAQGFVEASADEPKPAPKYKAKA